ncbi:hypothetical protein AX16_009564 [Volvariella volvacea WC 439]|nr:hypothetical protein AX16_009564 [Volvariella volvacea WC 439]
MSVLKSVLVILSITFYVSALSTPHIARGIHHRRAVAARSASPVAHDTPFIPIAKRTITRRCRPRNSTVPEVPSSTVVEPSSTVVEPSSAVAEPSSSLPPVNVAPSPTLPAISEDARPSTTRAQPTTTTEATPTPSPTEGNDGGNNGGNGGSSGGPPGFFEGVQTGEGTFFDTGLGSCGFVNTPDERIVAVSHLLYDSYPGYNGVNPNNNPICGRRINVRFQGRSTSVIVTDRCEGCKATDLDFSHAAFADLADFSVGRLRNIEWEWA